MIVSRRYAAVRVALTSVLGCSSVLFANTAARTLIVPAPAAVLAAAEPAGPEPGAPTQVEHSPITDDALRRSDLHLNTGKQFYFQGNLEGARREFDAAVDALLNAPESTPDHRRIEKHLDEICDLIYRFDLEKLGAGGSAEGENSFDRAPIDEVSHTTFPIDANITAKLKAELNQTASGFPLDLTEPVLSYVHFFSTERGRAILLAGLRRSGRYRPMIQKILAEEGLPEDVIYLAQAESGFLPRAVSNKQAVGMWQFISGTGSIYDLVRTSTLDERFDPEKATRAAAKYLKDLYARYGDWYLAMAAYNCGAGAVDRAIERTGYADYWELLKRRALPRETASYVPIIVAITIMAKNAHDYGLQDVELDAPLEYDSIQLSAPTNLNLIADATMQPVSVIRELNPALLKMVVPAGFQIHVPKGSADMSTAALERVPAGNRDAWRLHHVEPGDTLATIARTYHLSPDRIAAVNHATGSLDAGDVLIIPAVYHEPPERATSRSRKRIAGGKVTAAKTRKKASGFRTVHVAASRRVGGVLPRNNAVHSAAIAR